jgi:hypothetical protein
MNEETLIKPSVCASFGEYITLSTGTSYVQGTDIKVIRALEDARVRGYKVRVYYGSKGKVWSDEYDTIGKVGRSMGNIKILLLIASSRSMGGYAIMTDKVVRIDTNIDVHKATVYSKEGYTLPSYTLKGNQVYADNELYANCKSEQSAQRLVNFMSGKRWSK